jgi:hypothetical protein
MSLVGSIAVRVDATFSLNNCFVNAAERDSAYPANGDPFLLQQLS